MSAMLLSFRVRCTRKAVLMNMPSVEIIQNSQFVRIQNYNSESSFSFMHRGAF